MRIPNTGSPKIHRSGHSLPLGQKTQVPVEVSGADWKYVQRARKWTIEDAKGQQTELKVLKVGNEHALEIELPEKYKIVDARRLSI